MQNFISKIPLGDNKFAYEQAPAFRESGLQHSKLIKTLWTPPKHFFHVREGGHVAALKKHTPQSEFSKIDLSRFYYRVTKNKVIRSLKKIGLPYDVSAEIAAESVVRTDEGFSLPYGFTQSPILSSIVMEQSSLGKFLSLISKSVVTTVYVDDIILSTTDDTALLKEITDELVSKAENSGFPVNSEKSEFVMNQVTSFNVQLGNNSLTITDERMELFFEDLRTASTDAQVNGILNYVRQVNIRQFDLLNQYVQK
jgi:hypothetical protein